MSNFLSFPDLLILPVSYAVLIAASILLFVKFRRVSVVIFGIGAGMQFLSAISSVLWSPNIILDSQGEIIQETWPSDWVFMVITAAMAIGAILMSFGLLAFSWRIQRR